jgi:HSP20 family molecular chaperone IbpA
MAYTPTLNPENKPEVTVGDNKVTITGEMRSPVSEKNTLTNTLLTGSFSTVVEIPEK